MNDLSEASTQVSQNYVKSAIHFLHGVRRVARVCAFRTTVGCMKLHVRT